MDIRENFDYPAAMKQLINYYYEHCPRSIMPLFLLYLARNSKPGKEMLKVDEKIRKPLDWKDKPEQRYSSPILSQFTQEDAAELAKTDPAGAHLLDRWKCNEMDHMSIVVMYSNARLQEIRAAFQRHDESLGDSMNKRRALFLFVQGLLQCSSLYLKTRYIDIANEILKHAGVFEESDDIHISKFERFILGDIKGSVFVPYSRTPYAAALLKNATITTESSGPSSDLAAMASELILKGNGVKKAMCEIATKAYESIGDNKYDGAILNYAFHNEKTDYPSWHTCFTKIKNNLSDKAKYIGLIETKYLFKMVGKQQLFKEIIADNSLEAIVLLPRQYGLALISVNKAKKHPNSVKMVNLYNENSLDCRPRYFQQMVSRNSMTVSIETLAKEQTTIDSFFEESIPQLEGFNLTPLKKVLRRYLKESSFGVSNSPAPEDLSVIQIDRGKPYNPYDFMAESFRLDSFTVYEPTYYLDTESLLVNEFGNLDARLYRGSYEPAIFSGGLAFAISPKMWPPYLINELRKPYVLAQLNHWSASKEKRHSEDEILDLKIYIPDEIDPTEKERDICRKELDENILPVGSVVRKDYYTSYTVIECLGKGGFGITYLAAEDSFDFEEDQKKVVLKEFFSGDEFGSERFNGKRVAMPVGRINDIRRENDLHSFLVKFIDEAETMEYFSKFPGCRIRGARNIFLCEENNTYYYVTDYYTRGTLQDELMSNGPMSEEEFINRVMKPISIALDTMHNHHWLHFDIKAANIIIDDDGYAILGDLGISQHYDEKGIKVSKGAGIGTNGFCNELQRDADFIKEFHPELDIYAFAGMMYNAFTGNIPSDFSPEDLDSPFIELSNQTKEALRLAMDESLETTPKSIKDFMHLLPGCEKMEFPEIQKEEEESDFDFEDFDPNDFDDIPYFT